jgi:hypothetical protein
MRFGPCLSSYVLGLFTTLLISCGGDDGTNGATALLSWEPVKGSSVSSYTVHYGKQSSREPGSCAYEYSVDVSEPSARIMGLEFDTEYYFAVSSFNGERSLCSGEISKVL